MKGFYDYATELETRIWKTKGARYNKYRRYERKYHWSITSITMLSLYTLTLTLGDYFCAITFVTNHKALIPFLSVILSIFILILSLLEASKNYQIKSERLFNCANDITKLYDELRLFICSEPEQLDKCAHLSVIMEKYDNVLRMCPENHDPIDYELFMAEHANKFSIGWVRKRYILLKYFIFSYWLYLIFICAPPLIFVAFVYR